MLSLTLSQLVLPFFHPQIAKLSEASGITLPTTPCASTPLSSQSHTSSTSLGSFPGRCLELTLFSTPFSVLFAICVSYHHFGTPHTSPSLPWHVSWSPSALKSFPLLQTPLKNRGLVSLGGVAHLLSFTCWLLALSHLRTPLKGVLEDKKTQWLLQRFFQFKRSNLFLGPQSETKYPRSEPGPDLSAPSPWYLL